MLQFEVDPTMSLAAAKRKVVDELEERMVRRALFENGGSYTRAARALGISRPHIYKIAWRVGVLRRRREAVPETTT